MGMDFISTGTDCDTSVVIDLTFYSSENISQEILVSAGADHLVDLNNLFLTVDSIVLIDISPTNNVSCTDCANPTFSHTDNQTVIILITDEFNCTHTATIQFIVESDQSIFIPSVFSPNYDGINDVFQLYAGESNDIIIESMMIYNRWGDAVFSVSNGMIPINALSWDGMQGGKDAGEGVYIYDIVLRLSDDRVERRVGDLTLVR